MVTSDLEWLLLASIAREEERSRAARGVGEATAGSAQEPAAQAPLGGLDSNNETEETSMDDTGTVRIMFSDPTGTIERECAHPEVTQRSVALSYALAMRDEDNVAVDWARVNAAIRKRWPKGLNRVKTLAWNIATGKVQP